MMINEEKDRLVKLCQLWINDPIIKIIQDLKIKMIAILNMNAVSNYNGIIEGFEQNETVNHHQI